MRGMALAGEQGRLAADSEHHRGHDCQDNPKRFSLAPHHQISDRAVNVTSMVTVQGELHLSESQSLLQTSLGSTLVDVAYWLST
jgi:hypothetical protein